VAERFDPYPTKITLEPAEVRTLVGLTDSDEFNRFVASEPLFPRPFKMGSTASGKPRWRYYKADVFLFLELKRLGGEPPGAEIQGQETPTRPDKPGQNR
jgi:hypothetical protein